MHVAFNYVSTRSLARISYVSTRSLARISIFPHPPSLTTPNFCRAGVSCAPHARFGNARAPLSATLRERAHHGGYRRQRRFSSRVTRGSCGNEVNPQGPREGGQGVGRGREVEGDNGIMFLLPRVLSILHPNSISEQSIVHAVIQFMPCTDSPIPALELRASRR